MNKINKKMNKKRLNDMIKSLFAMLTNIETIMKFVD